MLKLLNQHPYKCGARRGAKKFRQNINRLQSLQKRHYKFANVRLNPKCARRVCCNAGELWIQNIGATLAFAIGAF